MFNYNIHEVFLELPLHYERAIYGLCNCGQNHVKLGCVVELHAS